MLILCVNNAYGFLMMFFIDSLFEVIPQEPKIVHFLESDNEEEVNGD